MLASDQAKGTVKTDVEITEYEEFVDIYYPIVNDVRRKIITTVGSGELYFCEICAKLNECSALVSFHLKSLMAADIIKLTAKSKRTKRTPIKNSQRKTSVARSLYSLTEKGQKVLRALSCISEQFCDDDTVREFISVMSSTKRRMLIGLMNHKVLSFKESCSFLKMDGSRFSFHLNKMKEAKILNFVKKEEKGTRGYYSLNEKGRKFLTVASSSESVVLEVLQ